MLYIIVALGGVVALSWELLWQIHVTLAVGVSAKSTAITLAATMGGMCIGAWLGGRMLSRRQPESPLRVYGVLEILIGLSGLLMPIGFALVCLLDGALGGQHLFVGTSVRLLGILLVLGPPTIAMGASIPVLGEVSKGYGTPLSRLYAVNTFGAGIGVLLMSFLVLPFFGVALSVRAAATVNLAVGVAALMIGRRRQKKQSDSVIVPATVYPSRLPSHLTVPIVWLSGFITFVLEVTWFRSMRAAFQDTTDSFAIILSSVLIALAIGARLVPWLGRQRLGVAAPLAAAGVAILLAAPVIERFDLLTRLGDGYWNTMLMWWISAFTVMGPPVLMLGMVLPCLLDETTEPRRWGRLYAWNTLGAIMGALLTAWVLLPAIGSARTAWLAGALTLLGGCVALGRRGRILATLAGVVALVIAVVFESGLGRKRIQADLSRGAYSILAFQETPDSTVSVVEYDSGYRALVIDGFQAASERGTSHYMEWMGRLPMLLHADPQRALVICFGTGQTANGVLQEAPKHLDIAELNGAVLELAPYFESNGDVLHDPRVDAHVIDGRAWLRRTRERYDVVTLEPMPPHFAGVNALYSKEFYELIAQRMNPGGIAAQWVPYHILPPEYAMSVTATFKEVFPDAIMWVDPIGKTGILLGRAASDAEPLGKTWPGLERDLGERRMTAEAIRQAVWMDANAITSYGDGSLIISDDNQLLSFGDVRRKQLRYGSAILNINLTVAARIAQEAAAESGEGQGVFSPKAD
jgi:spermidine synthase